MSGDLLELFHQIQGEVTTAFRFLDWAWAEIIIAQEQHPHAADLLYHATPLLARRRFGETSMDVEFVYRGHCRELLTRLAKGEDTRPATDTEICMVCSELSLKAPLNAAATGVYFSAWLRAFPDDPVWDGQVDEAAHHARMDGYEMRDMERRIRRQASAPARRLPPGLSCDGDHGGTPAECRFIPGTLDGAPVTLVAPRRRTCNNPARQAVTKPDDDPLALF